MIMMVNNSVYVNSFPNDLGVVGGHNKEAYAHHCGCCFHRMIYTELSLWVRGLVL